MIRIFVDWVDDAHDWPWFWLLAVNGISLHLKGADYPDGSAKHRGDEFWCSIHEIRGFRTERRIDELPGEMDGKPTYVNTL